MAAHAYISKYFLIRKVNFDIKIAKKRLCKISPSKNDTYLITKLGAYFSKYFLVRKVNFDSESKQKIKSVKAHRVKQKKFSDKALHILT